MIVSPTFFFSLDPEVANDDVQDHHHLKEDDQGDSILITVYTFDNSYTFVVFCRLIHKSFQLFYI